MLPLVIAPQPILRTKTKELAVPLSPTEEKFSQEMFLAMANYKGIGLAAPQVGQDKRLIVINTSGQPTAYFNPEIIKVTWRKVVMEEGCLSLPGVWGQVKRPQGVLAAYLTARGERRQEWLDGLLARVYQHEVDHLNGILFIDLTDDFTKGSELVANYGKR